MRRKFILFIPLLTTLGLASTAHAGTALDGLLDSYRQDGASDFSAERGAQLWRRTFSVEGQTRSCTTCHGTDLTATGKHQRTGKPIEPLAPRANANRLSERREMEKWLLRNCKWTLGRECTPQERGDALTYINSF